MTTTFLARTDVSGDGGHVWQVIDPGVETVETVSADPRDWFTGCASEAAHECGAAPGAQVRVLVFAAGSDPHDDDAAVYVDEYDVPPARA